jgi:Inner membrane protein YgaP-like, transmembrane domain
METNERPIDRIIRATVGAILLVIVFYSLEGPVALVEGAISLSFGIVGAFSLVTGLIGWCPAYALFRFSTLPPGKSQ